MSQRQRTGGTLALVVASIFIIIIVGVGLFFLAQQLGGGREAQHATDAGNLNVAKRALVSPSVSPDPNSAESLTFGGLFTDDNKVNLQIYNRFVGKAMLVALNAQADPGRNNIAKTHAATELALVEGPNGIGSRLYDALKQGSNTKDFFAGISQANSIRMLNWAGLNADSNSGLDEVAFMRQNAGAPSNVSITRAQFPPGTETVRDNGNYFKHRNGDNNRFFPFGYTPITVAGLSIYAVPVRPGEQPHLVSQEEFQAEKTSPLANGGTSLLPPNAFMSNSKSPELHGGQVTMRSSAIVGTLSTLFSASIPQGFIVVDNKVGGGLNNEIPPYANDIFETAIMNGVAVVPAGYMSENLGIFNDIGAVPSRQDVPLNYGDTLQPQAKLNGEPGRQARLNELRDQLQNGMRVATCNSKTAFTDPECKANLKAVKESFPPEPGGNEPSQLDGLMAVEWLKAEILRIRAGFDIDGPGCGFARVVPSCSGLKGYNYNPGSKSHQNNTYSTVPFGNDPGVFGNDGASLDDLMRQTNGTAFINAVQTRMHQINPEATDYTSVFNQSVPFNQIMYLYYDKGQRKFVLGKNLPFPAPDLSQPGLSLPDGTEQISNYTTGDLNGNIINVPGESGYPNPWDCPADDHGTSIDSCSWTPSSGYMNLLGIVKFRNCAQAGSRWCCPC